MRPGLRNKEFTYHGLMWNKVCGLKSVAAKLHSSLVPLRITASSVHILQTYSAQNCATPKRQFCGSVSNTKADSER